MGFQQSRESEIPPHQDYHHVNGNLTGIHETFEGSNLTRLHPSIREGPWDGADMKDWDTNFPEKILHCTLDVGDSEIDIWNIRAVPGSMHGEEKIKILNNTFNRIVKDDSDHCILTGDFNSPDQELPDGTVIPWRHDDDGNIAQQWVEAELRVLRGLENEEMIDVFRSLNGYGNLEVLDVSHATKTDDPSSVHASEVKGKRFDHMIASRDLQPQSCWYDQAGFTRSDHAPLIADFDC